MNECMQEGKEEHKSRHNWRTALFSHAQLASSSGQAEALGTERSIAPNFDKVTSA